MAILSLNGSRILIETMIFCFFCANFYIILSNLQIWAAYTNRAYNSRAYSSRAYTNRAFGQKVIGCLVVNKKSAFEPLNCVIFFIIYF